MEDKDYIEVLFEGSPSLPAKVPRSDEVKCVGASLASLYLHPEAGPYPTVALHNQQQGRAAAETALHCWTSPSPALVLDRCGPTTHRWVVCTACSSSVFPSAAAMSDTSPGTEPDMDVQEDEASCPPLPSASKRARAPSPSQEGPDKAPRTDSDTLSSQVAYVQASYLLRAASGARVFANPCRVSHALHLSTLGKYVLEGETRALGNGCALVVVIWEHNIPKVPELGQASFTLGEWKVTCRRAEREGPDYHYARVGPLDDSTDITEVRRDFRSFDGGEVVEITWIPAHNLPRYTTGKWLRLKVSGTLPTKVSISQLVYWARPYLLPLLRCSGCHWIGHSLNTCRSSVRCSRCSGPHPCRRDDITCTRPFRCFQCGGPHGPRSAHCTFNCRAQQLYADLAREGTPLHAINTQLRDLDLPSLPALRRPQPSPTKPAPAAPTLPPATAVHPGMSYSAIATGNRYGPLQEAPEDDASLPQAPVVDPEPGSTPPVPRRIRLRQPRRPPGYQAPPSIPTPPDLESEFTHSTIEAEVHRPHGSPPHRGEEPGRAFRHAAPLIPSPVMSPRPPAPPWHPDHSTAAPASSASSVDTVISSLFTLIWKGYHLYQKGTPVPAILTYLWPTLSMLISSLFE
ncbi:hypothetical protein GWK47_026089 [Chionoecetes opilio]|uniref:Uncharacterized protein n=1 Tax=Chionoecetes opilio TaxID=41210 RepID=A0A8J8WBU8_CHIOP|nr:hypothetical protein GWK47_026089 [Chionoecetes opilio]